MLKEKVNNIQKALRRMKRKRIHMLTNLDMFNTYLRPHLNIITPALSFAFKEVIDKYITKALGALKSALLLASTSLIKTTLEAFNQTHHCEYIHTSHKKIRSKLKQLRYKVKDNLDIEGTKEAKLTKVMGEKYSQISLKANVYEEI